MKRLAMILVWVACPAAAQPTIVQQLFQNVTVATTTSPISNVGQSGHFVQLQFTNAPAKTCGSPNSSAELEYSFDGSTWVAVGTPQLSYFAVLPKTTTYFGAGLYNYVRFKLASFDTVNCLATAWYTGTATPSFNAIQGILPAGASIGAGAGGGVNYAPVLMGGAGSTTLQPAVACDQSMWATVTAGTTSSIVNAFSGGNTNVTGVIHVCSIAITMAATGTVQLISSGSGGNCTTSPQSLTPAFHLAANTPLTLGSGLGTVLNGLIGTSASFWNLCATAVTGNADVFVTFAVY